MEYNHTSRWGFFHGRNVAQDTWPRVTCLPHLASKMRESATTVENAVSACAGACCIRPDTPKALDRSAKKDQLLSSSKWNVRLAVRPCAG